MLTEHSSERRLEVIEQIQRLRELVVSEEAVSSIEQLLRMDAEGLRIAGAGVQQNQSDWDNVNRIRALLSRFPGVHLQEDN